MNSNIVKIGKALKWRGVYDNSKKYYAENIVTCYGGVFRLNVSVAQGIPPYELNEEGLPTIKNSETWTCLVDTTWIIEWVLAFKKFKNEALARFEKDEKHIDEHCKKLKEHQKHLETLDSSIEDLKKKDVGHELLINNVTRTVSQVSNKADKNEKDIANINKKIGDSELTMGELQKQIQAANDRITKEMGVLTNTIIEQKKVINKNTQEIEALKNQIAHLQNRIELMSKYNCCFSGGIWDNDLYWNNDSLWNNGYTSEGGGTVIQPEMEVIGYTEETGELKVSGTVVSYDPKTGTLSIIDETNVYDESTGTLYIDGLDGIYQDEMTTTGYEEEDGNLGVSGSVTDYDEETGTLSIIDKTNSYDEETGTLFIDNLFG